MKTVLVSGDREALLNRLNQVSDASVAQWGKMNVGEMVCHLGDQLRVAIGEIETTGQGPWFARNVMKHLVLFGLPIPKEQIETFPEIDQAKERGTRPSDLQTDRAALGELLSTFLNMESGDLQGHSFFGKMSKAQWARLAYIHIDYHLRQFGV